MNFTADCVQMVERSRCWERERISVQDTPCGRVLVKGQRPRRGPFRFALLAGLARWMNSPLLRPVPQRGGAAAQATEVRRLRALSAAGVRVPAVLHESADHVVLQFLGGHGLHELFGRDAAQALPAFVRGLQALADVHARGQCLSQAFARNMLWCEGSVWMIDFEDDPLEVMPLAQAQARDWLAYLFSAVSAIDAPRAALMAHWQQAQQATGPEVRQLVRTAAQRAGWLRRLPARRKPWGRDVVRLQAVGAFLHEWNMLEPVGA